MGRRIRMAGDSGIDSRRAVVCILSVAIILAVGASVVSAREGRGFSADAVNTGLNSTVFIEVERTFHGERFTTTGTGFFISEDGHVLTNSHVVSDWIEVFIHGTAVPVEVNVIAIKVVVRPRTPQEKVLLGKVVAADRKRDLALIKASRPGPGYLELRPDTKVGLLEEVFVLGFPFGELLVLDDRGGVSRKGGFPEVSINAGRVASLRRDDSGNIVALQTDAAINPGNSGGPMLNADGDLVGVVYAKIGDSQIGFAIAPERVWAFLQEQRIIARFLPAYVTSDLRPVLLKVRAGALLDSATGGRVVIGGSGARSVEFDLIEDKDGWRSALEFPPLNDGAAADAYVVHVFLEDEKGRAVADRRYRILEQSRLAGSKPPEGPTWERIENEMTLSDHARKMAVAKAVDDGVVLKSKPPGQDSKDVADQAAEPLVDLEDLKARARTYYRGGNYEAAAEIFAQIVAADPDDEVSRDYLELSREHVRLGDGTQTTDVFEPTDVESAKEVGAGTAEITIYFHAQSGKGGFEYWLDGEPLQPFGFTARSDQLVKHTFNIDPGAHNLEVELRVGKRSRGKVAFERNFRKDSRWTLRFNLTSKNSSATAYLVERRD